MSNITQFRFQYSIWILLVLLVLLSSCSSSVRFASDKHSESTSVSSTNKSNSGIKKTVGIDNIDMVELNEKRKKIISEAEKWLGTPYCWGGESHDCADCSGFVMEVFKKAGVLLPRTAAEQYKIGSYVPIEKAKTGDLVFFQKGDKVSHVGIYVGNNAMLHASASSGVIIQDLATFGNNPEFIGCRKIVK